MFESLEELTRLGPEFAIRFLVAVLCGGAIGMERETTGKPAGLRTSIIVCVGAMIFTEMSREIAVAFGGDETRIAAQIVTGIGFLGAGVIIHDRGGVKGMTTAAMIWLMAALGMMIGSGLLITAMAVTAATVVLVLALHRMEETIHIHHARTNRFAFPNTEQTRRNVMSVLHCYDDSLRDVTLQTDTLGEAETSVSFAFVGPSTERHEFLHSLYQIVGIRRLATEEPPKTTG